TALMLTKKTTDPVPSPRIKNANLSPEVCYIIEKMCQRDEEARYQSPAELIKDLEAYLAGTLKTPTYERKTITEKSKTLKDKNFLKTIASKIPIAEIRQLLIEEKLPGEINQYNPGDVIFYEGDHSQEAYILLNGRLEVLKAGRKVAVISEPGTFVGEMATLLNSPRTATVRALSNALLLKLPATEFKTFLCQVPALAYQLAVNLSERLQQTTIRLKELQARLSAIRNYFQFISEELDQS
ncbi:MAG: cyclic nucleotide-binding domain-containing protein, partial [Candidatus Sumerlaeia bacterium]|nr:cyclic nucleotide-binding domain-containing protein [Candidatus Sumerlaeia bacterium]